jgi:tight adherence protein B
MVTGIAYILLGLVVIGMTLVYIADARARASADVDRRLAMLMPPGAAGQRAAETRPLSVSLPGLLVPLLARAELELTARRLRLLAWLMVAAALLALILGGPIAALAMLAGAPLGAWAWLNARGRKRTDALIEALPHYIDAVRQLQAVGNSLPQAIERALADAPGAVSGYFAPAVRRLEMGAPLAETMQQLAERLRIPEISMLAAAIRSNLRYSGSISTVLRNLAGILRERARVRWELKAATSEAKVSSRVLIAMPLLAMALLVAMNPGYVAFFTQDPRGQKLALVALGLEGMGILVLRRLLRLDF